MTSILESCITDWGVFHQDLFQITDNNGNTRNFRFSDQYTSFKKKLTFLINEGCDNYANIGDKNDWFIVDTIFRRNRNFVHIPAQQQANITVDEPQYSSMRPIFDKLIKLF